MAVVDSQNLSVSVRVVKHYEVAVGGTTFEVTVPTQAQVLVVVSVPSCGAQQEVTARLQDVVRNSTTLSHVLSIHGANLTVVSTAPIHQNTYYNTIYVRPSGSLPTSVIIAAAGIAFLCAALAVCYWCCRQQTLALHSDSDSTDFFLSHTQRDPDATGLASELWGEFNRRGKSCWLDVKMKERDTGAMERGVTKCRALVAIITDNGKDSCKRTQLTLLCTLATTHTSTRPPGLTISMHSLGMDASSLSRPIYPRNSQGL